MQPRGSSGPDVANRLEALAGDRRGQHSIRVNDKYRICFVAAVLDESAGGV